MNEQYLLFLKRLGALLVASISLEEAFTITLEQTRGVFKKRMEVVYGRIREGVSFADALSESKKTFDSVTLATIKASQISGNLGEGIVSAVKRLERSRAFRNELLSALLYPCIVSVIALALIFFLLGYVYPQIIPMFESFKATLPWSTRLVMSLSVFVRHYGVLALLGVIALVSCITYFTHKYSKARIYFEKCIFALPVFGRVYRSFHLHIIAEIMSAVMMREQVVQAIHIGASSSPSLILQKNFNEIAERVQEGVLFSVALDIPGIHLPSIWKSMIIVGERTGQLQKSFENLADFHKEELRLVLLRTTKLIEPLLMVFTGLVVGVIALSIVTPLYGLTETIQGV